MKKTLCLSVLLASWQLCLGQLTSQIPFAFGPGTAPVWDITGAYVPYHNAFSGGQTNEVAYMLGLNLDSNGRIRSSGGTVFAIGNDYVAASYTATGSVSGGGTNTHANFSVRLAGFDMIAGAPRKFSVSLSYKFTVDPATFELVGKANGSIYINGVGNSRVKEDFSLPLPDGADGSWNLTLNILSMGHIGGSGTIGISNYTPVDNPAGFPTDRLMPATVSGSYSQHTGLSKVSVKGLYDGRGSSVSITFNPVNNSVEKLSGKVLGQSVKFSKPSSE